MKILNILVFCFFLLFNFAAYSQDNLLTTEIKWEGLQKETGYGFETRYLSFQDAVTDPSTMLPLFTSSFDLEDGDVALQCVLSDAVYEDFTTEENSFVSETAFQNKEIEINSIVGIARKKPLAVISFIPIKYDISSGSYKKLVSFTLETKVEKLNGSQVRTLRDYADHSVLSIGDWYKIKVEESGVCKITFADLQSYGIDPTSINPKNIRLYGNGLGMLPEANAKSRPDDLIENAIFVMGEEDGSFDENDYILFYGRSPHIWYQVLYSYFAYEENLYADYNYYFLSVSDEEGKRIETIPSSVEPVTDTVNTFNDYQVYQTEQINLIESGKEWYSDEFGSASGIYSKSFLFDFPALDTSELVVVKSGYANRTFFNETMVISVNDVVADSLILTTVGETSIIYARVKKKTINYISESQEIKVDLEYLPVGTSSKAWLDYIAVNATSHLKMIQGQLLFRDLISVGSGKVSEFTVNNAMGSTVIWDITNGTAPQKVEAAYSNSELVFTLSTDSIREFIAHDGTSYLSPIFDGLVENQDMHGLVPADLVIVTHPDFYEAAERLKLLHETKDDLSVILVTLDEIYNEFSSGGQDITAIRDFLKMLYDKSESAFPRLLLLMGDGSFDPKDRVEHNTNYIPTFQTKESWNEAGSMTTDDYYGFLDDGEGNDASGILDLGIGRLPVQTIEEANDLVDKIESYLVRDDPQYGSWRNQICIVADDEDTNLHIRDADTLARMINRNDPIYNVNKIYLDAYPQASTPTGHRYPDVTNAINEQMEKGTLIMNYVGHGGMGGWADERILVVPDINNWSNADKLPIFVTATCAFSRFDFPEKRSAGELVLMNMNGGGIALFTTVRLAYSQSNFALNKRFYEHVFERVNGEYPFMGDVMRDSKPPGSPSTRNFALLGDPALRIAYPDYNITTSEISTLNSSNGDTLSALSEVTVTGVITDLTGEKVSSFNGEVFPVLYDKPAEYRTLANDPDNSYAMAFYSQNRILYKGKASVTNGGFSFSFIVPRDIAIDFGNGKISYYAMSENADASGYYNELVIGGINVFADEDEQGPQIQLFLNDDRFVSGDLVSPDPVLIANLFDGHGINLSHNGIGHDIVATIDGDNQQMFILNDYYEPALDDYKKGSINYPFHNLPDGKHNLSLKVWDSYNNSSTASIDFVIDNSTKLQISEVMNYPNPFGDKTWFSFKHTRPETELNVEISIFDLSGRMVLRSTQTFASAGISSPIMEWDGTDASGNAVKGGMYIYTVIVTDGDGGVSRETQKLILMK